MKTKTLLIAAILAPATMQGALIKSYEFNSPGDLEGFTAVNVTGAGLTVSGGNLSGVASTGDIQLINNVLATRDAGSSWTSIVFRVRETDESSAVVTPFSNLGLAAQLGPNATPTGITTVTSTGFSGTDAGGGFFEVTADISAYTQSTINYLRLDPIGGPDAAGNTFEVDFIRIYDSSVIPEPSTALLSALGALALLRRRR